MALTAELAEKVEALYRKRLEEEFGDAFTFDPVWIEPDVNSLGQDSFKVIIVYKGKEGEHPNPKKIIAVMAAMTDPLTELGLPPTLIESYVPKHEFPMLMEMLGEPPWAGLDE